MRSRSRRHWSPPDEKPAPHRRGRRRAGRGAGAHHRRVEDLTLTASRKRRVAVLISGRGSNMASLIEAAKAPDYPAEIVLVISNRPDAEGLARAAAAGVADRSRRSQDLSGARGLRACARRGASGAWHRASLLCRLHAHPDAVVHRALDRTDAERPSVAAAAVHGPPHASAGARGRHAHPRLHSPLRHARARCRADHRAGRGAGAGSGHGRDARRPRAAPGASSSTRWLYSLWRGAAFTSSTDAWSWRPIGTRARRLFRRTPRAGGSRGPSPRHGPACPAIPTEKRVLSGCLHKAGHDAFCY